MKGRMRKLLGFTVLLCAFVATVFADDLAPSTVEVRREEFLLKQRLRPDLKEVLKDQYRGLSVHIRYVLVHDPIVSQKSKISRLRLPGFGTQVSIAHAPDDISGYIDKYMRYRTITLITQSQLSEAIASSIGKLVRDNENLELGGKDTLNFFVLAEEGGGAGIPELIVQKEEKLEEAKDKKDKEKVDDLVEKLDKERKEKKETLAKLFPELEQAGEPVDPRQEAESSKHLILSKKAYYNNDLNAALNEVIEAININPYASKSYEMLGSIYYRLKWYNLALNNWEKASALDPGNRKLNKFIQKAKSEL